MRTESVTNISRSWAANENPSQTRATLRGATRRSAGTPITWRRSNSKKESSDCSTLLGSRPDRHHVRGSSLVALPSLADRGLPQSARGGSAAHSRRKQSRAASVHISGADCEWGIELRSRFVVIVDARSAATVFSTRDGRCTPEQRESSIHAQSCVLRAIGTTPTMCRADSVAADRSCKAAVSSTKSGLGR